MPQKITLIGSNNNKQETGPSHTAQEVFEFPVKPALIQIKDV